MIQTINNAMSKRREAIENGDKEKGFTLIELMVVIIIIGILAAIAIPAFLNQRQAAWDASVKSDLGNASIAAESYSVANNGQYKDMTLALLQGAPYNLKLTTDNVLTVTVGAGNQSYVITGYNKNSGATGHTFTNTSGTITGP